MSGRGSGGGADDTGWGNGGEGFRGFPLVSGGVDTRPQGADDSGWGDTNDPRALVAMVASLGIAAGSLARSGALTSGLRR
jgi:hypothetical protein